MKNGFSVADLEGFLSNATDPGRIPLSLLALDEAGEPVGTINLIDNDDRDAARTSPLAGGAGGGAGLARGAAWARPWCARWPPEAARLGFAQLYFGTDGPGFYERLGAQRHLERGPDFWIMRGCRWRSECGAAPYNPPPWQAAASKAVTAKRRSGCSRGWSP